MTTDLVDLLARHWGLGAADVRPLGGGMNSQTWLVQDASVTYVAKQVAASALTQLAAGGQVATDLTAAGLVTGSPVPTREGELVVASHALALLEFVPGREARWPD